MVIAHGTPPSARRVAVDAGGIPLAAGGRMRTGVVYRVSGALVRAEELGDLEALQLDLLVDLRGAGERRDTLQGWAQAHTVRYEHVPIDSAAPQQLAEAGAGATEEDGFAHLRSIYRQIVDRHGHSFARTLTLIADAPRAGFGCAAGKDRTGLVAAFLHVLLGASEEQAADYYVASAPSVEQLAPLVAEYFKLEPGTPMPPGVAALLGVSTELLLETFEELRRRHSSIEGYLLQAGMSPEVPARLRRHLVVR